MIDSEWFYRELDSRGRSLRDMAKALGLDSSAVSRMLRGERKMSAEEQDRIADYLGVTLHEVAARRRGERLGFAEEGQERFSFDEQGRKEETAVVLPRFTQREMEGGLNLSADNFYDRVRGCMKGTVTIAPGDDLTGPADPEWAKVYDD
ncbi:helix-turn-helix transcriptional regulator [Agrobacterium sp. a22-2]|uniref:helix-turn-helix domain-containing protein n=1 Tax=Agrobacterium sp. a22-2 TaxID=2283840 RepID=UPI001445B275|nr:helix-turn-helix transcriptional regulator [Agrobacterium sp. a22-2]NKN36162.1 helix-turn-helix transcriptional regulator [Agrobacterium sp. a22-2]